MLKSIEDYWGGLSIFMGLKEAKIMLSMIQQ